MFGGDCLSLSAYPVHLRARSSDQLAFHSITLLSKTQCLLFFLPLASSPRGRFLHQISSLSCASSCTYGLLTKLAPHSVISPVHSLLTKLASHCFNFYRCLLFFSPSCVILLLPARSPDKMRLSFCFPKCTISIPN